MSDLKFEMTSEKLNELIEHRVVQLVDSKFDDVVQERALKILDRVIAHLLGEEKTVGVSYDLERLIDKHVCEHVKEALEKSGMLSEERLERVKDDIADSIASKLKSGIIESISWRLKPYDEDEEEY